MSPNCLTLLTPTKYYDHQATSNVKELLFSSPDIPSTSAQQIQDIINMPNSLPIDTPQKKKLKRHIQIQSKKLKNKRSYITKLKTNLKMYKTRNDINNIIKQFPFPSISSKALVTMQLRKNRRSWTVEEKQLSLTLFYKSPATYNFFKLQNVNLPGTSTIHSWIGQSKFLPGFSKIFLNHVQKKFEFKSEKEKKCTLCFDEMSIKEYLEFSKYYDFIEGFEDLGHLGRTSNKATIALVFMTRGIYAPWKIPVAYYLARSAVKHDKLKQLIIHVLETLFETGLCPKLIICDQGSNNQSALKSLNVTENKPYFFINDKKIHAIFDVPHLLKSIRNNLIGGSFKKGNKTICYSDIRETYNADKKKH